MPRSLLEVRQALPGLIVVPHPVFPPQVKREEWWRWPGTAAPMVSEYHKFLFALLRGALAPAPAVACPAWNGPGHHALPALPSFPPAGLALERADPVDPPPPLHLLPPPA